MLGRLVLSSLLAASLLPAANAADDELDPTFGAAKDGRVTLDIAPGASDATVRMLDTGEHLYAVGTSGSGIAIARLLPNGLPDTQFLPARYPDDGTPIAVTATAAVLDGAGGVVVGGHYATLQPAAGPFWIACRFEADGTPDPSFGSGEVLPGCATDFASGVALRGEIRDMAIQLGGRLVFAGYSLDGGQKMRATLSSLDAGGAPDTTFSDDGMGDANLVMPLAQVVPESIYNALSFGTFNDLVAAGEYRISASNSDILVSRMTADGLPFQGFGANGNVVHALDLGPVGARRDIGTDVAVATLGRLVVAGSAETSAEKKRAGALLWLLPTGAIDTTLGNNGRTVAELPSLDMAFGALVRMPDGQVVVAGTVTSLVEGASAVVVVRARADGEFDETFGPSPVEFVSSDEDVGGPTRSSLADLILQDDRIIVAGSSRVLDQDSDFGIARLGDRRLFNDGFEPSTAP